MEGKNSAPRHLTKWFHPAAEPLCKEPPSMMLPGYLPQLRPWDPPLVAPEDPPSLVASPLLRQALAFPLQAPPPLHLAPLHLAPLHLLGPQVPIPQCPTRACFGNICRRFWKTAGILLLLRLQRSGSDYSAPASRCPKRDFGQALEDKELRSVLWQFANRLQLLLSAIQRPFWHRRGKKP